MRNTSRVTAGLSITLACVAAIGTAAPANASDGFVDLEGTAFVTKTSIKVMVGDRSNGIGYVVANVGSKSCSTSGPTCTIRGLDARKGAALKVTGYDHSGGSVMSHDSLKLKRVVPIRSTRYFILCRTSGKKFEFQDVYKPWSEFSYENLRVKLAPAGKRLPKKWKTTGRDEAGVWAHYSGLKVGRMYHAKARSWNVLGWGPVVTRNVRADRWCV